MKDNEQLSDSEVSEALENLKIWGVEGEKLVTGIEFEDYREAVFFANMVFSLAEEEFHHPEVMVSYGEVQIDLYSHDAEGITERDIDMAQKIEERLGDVDWS